MVTARRSEGKKIKRSLVFFIGLVLGIFITYAYALPQDNSPKAVNDGDYFPVALDVLENAEDSIHIIIFEVKYYDSFQDSNEMFILYELVNAKKRGVDVKVITDQFYTSDEAVQYLRDNGIDVKYDSSSVTTHSKLLIIDGETVIIGSTNWSYYSIDRNHESNVLIKSRSTAQQFEDYFEEIWSES